MDQSYFSQPLKRARGPCPSYVDPIKARSMGRVLETYMWGVIVIIWIRTWNSAAASTGGRFKLWSADGCGWILVWPWMSSIPIPRILPPFFSSSFESNNIYSFKNRIKLTNLANYPITLLIRSLLLNWLISGSISEFNWTVEKIDWFKILKIKIFYNVSILFY